ncbi:MAG: hypothetical protein QOG62_1746 [Thermoleophilaceae bacterium]|nr:hypothetical protein [Thermoleophilaceae bacterium]
MSTPDYLFGLALFLLMLGGVVGGAQLLVRRRLDHLAGATRVTAFGLVATLGVLAVHVVPGMLGILSQGTVLAATAIWLAAAAATRTASPGADPAPDPAPGTQGGGAARALAMVGIAALGVYVLAVGVSQLTVPARGVDFTTFHLPVVAGWIQSGSIWDIRVFLPDLAPGHYPNNGDILMLAAVLPWRNDFLAHLVMYPFWVLTGVALYALGRRLAAPWPLAALAACVVLLVPVVAVPALTAALVDTLMLFGMAAGVLFLLRHWRSGRTSDLVLAGLALGVSLGTKWYGLSSIAVVVVVWLGACVARRIPAGALGRRTAALLGLIAVGGGVWLLRNWIHAGNPVYPVALHPFGIPIFDAPPDYVRNQAGFSVAYYLGSPEVWVKYLLPQLRDAAGLPAALGLACLAGASGVVAWARIRGRDLPYRGEVLAGLICAALLLITYAVTPYTAAGPRGMPLLTGPDSRYGVPALVIAAPVMAWLADRSRRGSIAFAVLALAAVADGIVLTTRGVGNTPALTALDWAIGLVAAAVVALVVWLVRSRPRDRRVRSLQVAVVVAVVLLAAGGLEVEQRYNAQRYTGDDAAMAWLAQNADSGQRVALAGLWSDQGIAPVLPSFGSRLGNQVEYVGWREQDTLRRYSTRDAFVAALNRGDFDYVVAGNGRVPGVTEPEAAWARSDGFRVVAQSPRLTLLQAP